MSLKIFQTNLKAISLPLIGTFLLFTASSSVSAKTLWENSHTESTDASMQLISKEVERSRRDIPDVIIDDEETRSEDGSTSTEQESEDETSTTASNEPRFTCQMVNGEYTVMYHPESRPEESYAWAIPRQMGGGWSPERRCNEISRRLESYRPDGLLEMRTAVENNYNTVCVTTQQDASCRIVFTVPSGQDPRLTRDRVFENLTVADSGQQTQGVNTLVNDGRFNPRLGQLGRVLNQDLSKLAMGNRFSDGIDLRPFLDPADGGTGMRLQGSPFKSTVPNSQRLEPENFR